MKLSYRIISRISAALLILFTIWATLFYFIIIDEINDETDDSLENYSEIIIQQVLAGIERSTENHDLNNLYFITEISTEEASRYTKTIYYDEMVYIPSKKETEPVRTLKTIFEDGEGKFYELKVSIPTIEKADLRGTILR